MSRNESELLAFFNTLGFKITKTNLSQLKTIKGYEFRRKVKGIQEKIRIEANKFNKGQITQLEYNERVNDLNETYTKIRNKFIEDVNIPVDYQEGAELSEVIPRITGAIKEQTEGLFGKN